MRTQSPFDDGRTERTRLLTVAVVALVIGTLLSPGIAAAASATWVKIKNWPAIQKVLVTNSASAPVYTQPPAHSIVNLHGSATIQNFQFNNSWSPYYAVPAGQYLVITSARMEGSGNSPISFIDLSTYNNIHLTFPFTPFSDNGVYVASSVLQGPIYVPGGTTLYLAMARNTAPSSSWSATVWIDGYLTDKP